MCMCTRAHTHTTPRTHAFTSTSISKLPILIHRSIYASPPVLPHHHMGLSHSLSFICVNSRSWLPLLSCSGYLIMHCYDAPSQHGCPPSPTWAPHLRPGHADSYLAWPCLRSLDQNVQSEEGEDQVTVWISQGNILVNPQGVSVWWWEVNEYEVSNKFT